MRPRNNIYAHYNYFVWINYYDMNINEIFITFSENENGIQNLFLKCNFYAKITLNS